MVRSLLTATFFVLAVMGACYCAYMIAQPNSTGDYVTGMAQVVLAIIGAIGALYFGLLALLLKVTALRTWGVLLIGAVIAALAYGFIYLS